MTVPVGRKVSDVKSTVLTASIIAFLVLFVGVYIYQVNAAASQGYALRALERQQETASESVSILENQMAQLQTIHAIQERVQSLGYVPVDQVDYVNANGAAYAMR